MNNGVFTLSLDFELIWGTLNYVGPRRYRHACEVESERVVNDLLALLEEFRISATWCVVGHLMLDSCAPVDGVKHPEITRPQHAWHRADWFVHDPCGDERSDPIFYGRTLVEKVRACPVHQEIGCHSFSHVIFGDHGCGRATAESELTACVELASKLGIEMRSFAFPSNRVGHLDVLRKHDFTCFRGPDRTWYERPRVPSALKRAGHLVDVITTRRPPVVLPVERNGLLEVPGSMIYFPMHGLRRYIPLEMRVRRVNKGLERAVEEKKIFHLWFHPTNLADGLDQMLAGLRTIFERAAQMREAGDLVVAPMGRVPDLYRRAASSRQGHLVESEQG